MVKLLENDIEEGILSGASEDVTNIVEDIDAQINSMTSEFGADKMDAEFAIKVYRVIEGKGELAWLFACVPSELPIMQKLQDDFGGGRFEVRIYKNKKIFRRIPVVVSPPLKSKEPVPPPQNDLTALVNAIATQQERQFNQLKETLLQIAGRNTAAPPDTMAMMGAMMGAMTQMKDFLAPAQNNSASISPDKMIDVLMKGMEIGRDSGGGGGGETNFLDIVKTALTSPLLLSAATQAVRPPATNPVSFPAPQIPGKTNANPVKITQPVETNKMNPIIQKNLNMLVTKAENDADPILYAEFILDNVPESMVRDFILRDNLIEELNKINPKVEQHKEWFLQLRNHIQAVLTGEGEGEDDSEDAPSLDENASSPNDVTGNPGGDAGHKADA